MALRRKLRKAELRWRKDALSGLLDADELATVALEPEQGQAALAAGSRPQRFLRDKDGRRYLFKTAPDQLIAAELFASGLRARGGRACLPAGRRIVNLVDRYAELHAQLSEINAEMGTLKAQLVAVGDTNLSGTFIRAAITTSKPRITVDWKAVAAELEAPEPLIALHTKVGDPIVSVRLYAK